MYEYDITTFNQGKGTHFLFLQLYNIYKAFKTIYQAPIKLNQ
jgi:hypothetical protein